AESVADAARVDVGAVAEDHPREVESPDPLRDRRRGEAHAATQLGERHASVGLQLGDETHIGLVEKGAFGKRAVSPYIRSHDADITSVRPCTWRGRRAIVQG